MPGSFWFRAASEIKAGGELLNSMVNLGSKEADQRQGQLRDTEGVVDISHRWLGKPDQERRCFSPNYCAFAKLERRAGEMQPDTFPD